MERARRRSRDASLLLLFTVLLTQNLVIPVMSTAINVGDQKNFYFFAPPTDPRTGTPPIVLSPPTVISPPIIVSPPSGGSYGTPPARVTPVTPPSSGTTPSGPLPTYGTPPSHGGGTTTPSHGSGTSPSHGHHGHGGTPPAANCGNPPSGHHSPTPAPPTSGGGGGYHNSPPTAGHSPPTVTPTTPSTPTTPTITPTTPIPGTTVPSPPFDPNSPIGGPCSFWRSHPTLIWTLFGWWGNTVCGVFGVTTIPGYGANLSLQQALSNTRTDGLGALYREGTAALLNSMVNSKFPIATNQVRERFVAALNSNKAAAAQARIFKRANESLSKSRV